MRIDSVIGKGTTVSVLFPRAADDTDADVGSATGAATSRAPSERRGGWANGIARILVVDDEADCRETVAAHADGKRLSRWLRQRAARRRCAWSDEGLDFHLLLVDVAMPGMSGIELAQKVRARRPLVRWCSSPAVMAEWISGERWVLMKPFLTRALIETLRAALGLTQDTDAARSGVGKARRGRCEWQRYVAARLIQLLFVLIGVSVVVFVTMHLLPGDVAQLLLGDHATNEQLQRLREQLGLDQPVWVQYGRFMRERAARRSRRLDPEQPSGARRRARRVSR